MYSQEFEHSEDDVYSEVEKEYECYDYSISDIESDDDEYTDPDRIQGGYLNLTFRQVRDVCNFQKILHLPESIVSIIFKYLDYRCDIKTYQRVYDCYYRSSNRILVDLLRDTTRTRCSVCLQTSYSYQRTQMFIEYYQLGSFDAQVLKTLTDESTTIIDCCSHLRDAW